MIEDITKCQNKQVRNDFCHMTTRRTMAFFRNAPKSKGYSRKTLDLKKKLKLNMVHLEKMI